MIEEILKNLQAEIDYMEEMRNASPFDADAANKFPRMTRNFWIEDLIKYNRFMEGQDFFEAYELTMTDE